MKKILKLAATAAGVYVAIGAAVRIREHEARIEHLRQAYAHIVMGELELFVQNAPRRVTALESQITGIGAVVEIIQRGQAQLQDQIDDLKAEPELADRDAGQREP